MNTNTQHFILNFICGGLLIAISGVISDAYSSKLSGMFYASFPLGLFYLYLYVYLKKNKDETKKFALYSIIGGIIWTLIAVALYLMNKEKIGFNLIISSILYISLIIASFLSLKQLSF